MVRALLIGPALTCICLSAYAQSSLTLYGILDLYLQWGQGDRHQTTVQSGGVSSSRLGFKGTEALGTGLSAVFVLESGILADVGAYAQGGLTFGRQAHVGLASSTHGTLSLGRQYVPQYVTLDAADPYGTGAGSAASSGIVATTSRSNNAVVYKSPVWRSLSGTAMIGLGESESGSRHGNLHGASVQYAPGMLTLGLAWSQIKKASASKADANYLLLTGAYDLGSFKMTGGLQTVNNLGGSADVDRREFFGGVIVPWGQDEFSAGVGAGKTRRLTGSRAVQWTLGYAHPLSRHTRLYAVGTRIHNGRRAAHTSNAATGTGPSTSAGRNVSALLLGVRHAF